MNRAHSPTEKKQQQKKTTQLVTDLHDSAIQQLNQFVIEFGDLRFSDRLRREAGVGCVDSDKQGEARRQRCLSCCAFVIFSIHSD